MYFPISLDAHAPEGYRTCPVRVCLPVMPELICGQALGDVQWHIFHNYIKAVSLKLLR